MLFRELASAFDGAGAFFRRESGGGGIEAAHSAILLFAGHGQQAADLLAGCAARDKQSSMAARKRIFVNAVGGDAGGAAVDDGANGDNQAVLGDMLMDGVVGEARERVESTSSTCTSVSGTPRALARRRTVCADAVQFAFRAQVAPRAAAACDVLLCAVALIGLKRLCRFLRCENARAKRHAPCPWSAWAGPCRNSECPRAPSDRHCRWRRRNSRIPW